MSRKSETVSTLLVRLRDEQISAAHTIAREFMEHRLVLNDNPAVKKYYAVTTAIGVIEEVANG